MGGVINGGSSGEASAATQTPTVRLTSISGYWVCAVAPRQHTSVLSSSTVVEWCERQEGNNRPS